MSVIERANEFLNTEYYLDESVPVVAGKTIVRELLAELERYEQSLNSVKIDCKTHGELAVAACPACQKMEREMMYEDLETLARAVLAHCNPSHWQGNDDHCKRFACVTARRVLDASEI